jgi:DNA-binding LacI/PurR family transcriptional regulator
MARPLRIGLLTSSLQSPFVMRAAAGLQEVLAAQGAELEALELQGRGALDYHQFIEMASDRLDLDAYILCHLRLNVAQLLRFKRRGVPMLGLTERLDGFDWCTVDEMGAAVTATRHLLDLGHRQIALINGPAISLQARLREDGFLRALAEAGLKPGRDNGLHLLNFAENEGYEAGHLLADLPWAPSAVFVAAGDLAARGVMQALMKRHLRVPEDIAVIGFDGLYFAEALGLSTVEQPLEEMGRWAGRSVLNALRGGAAHQAQSEQFQAELFIRRSTGAPVSSIKPKG